MLIMIVMITMLLYASWEWKWYDDDETEHYDDDDDDDNDDDDDEMGTLKVSLQTLFHWLHLNAQLLIHIPCSPMNLPANSQNRFFFHDVIGHQ